MTNVDRSSFSVCTTSKQKIAQERGNTKKAFPRSTTRAEGKDAAGRRYSVLSEVPSLRYHAIRHLRGGGLLHSGKRVQPKC